jgi:ferredoxin
MASPPHQLVSPEGVLHLVPSEDTAKKKFCDKHGLRVAYLNYHINGNEQYRVTHGGWTLLDRVSWLQQSSSGVIVVVVGKPKQFYNIREGHCERAGLARDAMPFSLRQLQRLLNPDDDSVEELEGWTVVEEPPLVRNIACWGTCTTCLCSVINLYELLSPQEPDELTRLRRQLAVRDAQLARVAEERDKLRDDLDRVGKARETIARTARRRKTRIESPKAKMVKLTEASHLKFEQFLSTAPPAARHLKHLFDAQLRALRSKSLRTYWHEEILSWFALSMIKPAIATSPHHPWSHLPWQVRQDLSQGPRRVRAHVVGPGGAAAAPGHRAQALRCTVLAPWPRR